MVTDESLKEGEVVDFVKILLFLGRNNTLLILVSDQRFIINLITLFYNLVVVFYYDFANSVVGELVHQEIQDGESWSDSGVISSLLHLGPGDDDSHIQPG